MKFGVRECAEVVLRAKSKQQIGKRTFYKNEPVVYFDTLNTSSLEGAATTVYAQGGPGNARLLAWEGERTLTFTMEDALISPEGLMILSGAGLIEANDGKDGKEKVALYVHTTSQVKVETANTIDLPKVACWSHSGEMLRKDGQIIANAPTLASGEAYPSYDLYHDGADIFVMVLSDGEVNSEPCIPAEFGVKVVTDADGKQHTRLTCYGHKGIAPGDIVLVDYYVKREGGVKQIEITPDKFGGYFYLEAQTLFRRESDGKDLPAEFIIPKCKIQSNFTFTMASSGDPSTFTFTLDAFPDYTKFDGTKKVLAAIQVVESEDDEDAGEDFARRGHCTPVDPSGSGEEWDNVNGHFDYYGKKNAFGMGYAYTDDDKASATYATKSLKDVINAGVSYSITVGAVQNGTVSTDDNGFSGERITVNAVPAAGYKISNVKYNGTAITADADGKYIFTMPSENVTVTAEFEEDE